LLARIATLAIVFGYAAELGIRVTFVFAFFGDGTTVIALAFIATTAVTTGHVRVAAAELARVTYAVFTFVTVATLSVTTAGPVRVPPAW